MLSLSLVGRSDHDMMRTVLNHGHARPHPPLEADDIKDGPFKGLCIEAVRGTKDAKGRAGWENAGTAASGEGTGSRGRRKEQIGADAQALLLHKRFRRLI